MQEIKQYDYEDSLISGILKESDSEIDSFEAINQNQYQLEMILRESDNYEIDEFNHPIQRNIVNQPLIISNPKLVYDMLQEVPISSNSQLQLNTPDMKQAEQLSELNEIMEIDDIQIDRVLGSITSSKSLERKQQKISDLPQSPLQLQQLPYPENLNPTSLAVSENFLAVASKKNSSITILKTDQWEVFRIIEHPEQVQVSVIDIQESILVAGYKNGQILVWDAFRGKYIKRLYGIHNCEFAAIKIKSIEQNRKVRFISSDVKGNIFLITVQQMMLLSYCFDRQRLIVQSPRIFHEIKFLHARSDYEKQYQLVTLASQNDVLTLCLHPVIKIIHRIQKPKFVKKEIVPQIDWGYCRFNSDSDELSPILSICWAQAIQLISFSILIEHIPQESLQDQLQQQEISFGYYLSKYNINYCGWISDDILIIYDSFQSFKILYAPSFVQVTKQIINDKGKFPSYLSQYELEYANQDVAKLYSQSYQAIFANISFKQEMTYTMIQEQKYLSNTICKQ